MRKLFVLALAAGALILCLGVSAGSAEAACGTKCLNKKINNLQSQLGALQGQVGTLQGQVANLNTQLSTANSQLSCIRTATSVTRYFGYNFASTILTTALDNTDPGDSISFWVPIIQPGTCGLSTVRGAAARGAGAQSGFTPFQPGPPQTKN